MFFMKKEEQKICIAFFKHISTLQLLGKVERHCILHYPVGQRGSNGKIQGAIDKAMGAIAGVPDYIVFYDGGVAWMECKTDKGRLSKKQKEFRDIVMSKGQKYFVFRSIDEGIAILHSLGLVSSSVIMGKWNKDFVID